MPDLHLKWDDGPAATEPLRTECIACEREADVTWLPDSLRVDFRRIPFCEEHAPAHAGGLVKGALAFGVGLNEPVTQALAYLHRLADELAGHDTTSIAEAALRSAMRPLTVEERERIGLPIGGEGAR